MNENELWLKIKESLSTSEIVDEEVYNDYITTAKLIKNDQDEYNLVVKSQFAIRVITPLKDIIVKEIKKYLGRLVIFNFITAAQYKENQKQLKEILATKPVSQIIAKKYNATFENFIEGESNKQAFLASKMIAHNPGKQYIPLFIYGDSGLGKTHLLHAIYNEISDNKPELKTLFLSSEALIKRVVDVLYKDHEAIEAFKEEIMAYDVLLIDDIQFLAKKEKTNEIFFTIFNHFIENSKQLVFSSDKSPDNLNGFDKRIITRFDMGLTTSIKTLDFETAALITKAEIRMQGIKQSISYEALNYIATYYADDVRKIKGSISKISFWGIQNEPTVEIDMEVISTLFKDVSTANLGILNVKKVKEIVGEKYGVSVKSIDGKARTANIANARHLSMYLVKNILNHSLSQIGNEFGGKDHTTVINAVNKIENLINTDKNFKLVVEVLKTKILSK